MAWLLNTISDTSNEVVVSCTAASAEGAATVVDASSLLGNAGAGTEVLDIAAISWCSNGALTLEFDATQTDLEYFTAEVSFKYNIYNIVSA